VVNGSIHVSRAIGEPARERLGHRDLVVLDALLCSFADTPNVLEVHPDGASPAAFPAGRLAGAYLESQVPDERPDVVDVVVVDCSGRAALQMALERICGWTPMPPVVLFGGTAQPVPFVEAVVADLIEARAGRLAYRPVARASVALAASRLALLSGSESEAALDGLLRRLAERYESTFDPLLVVSREQELVRAASAELAATRTRLTREQARTTSLEASLSWRLTRPLRRLARRSSSG
jgi:hypothetical protein